MANKIEKLNTIRKLIVWGVFLGTTVGLTWYLLPYLPYFKLAEYIAPKGFFWNHDRAAHGALLVWLATIFFFGIIYWLYKIRLKKNPQLRAAVYDERIRLNWLKAYRIAFLAAFCVSIAWKIYEMVISPQLLFTMKRIPHGPFLILPVAVASLTGAFLFYNREAKHE